MRYVVLLLATALLSIGNLHASQADHVTTSHAWIRLLPVKLPASGYVTLQNHSATAVTLVSAHSSAYAFVRLHQSTVASSGMSNMSMVAQLDIPAQGKVTLAPAGYHLMLEDPHRALEPGDIVDITLDFSDGSQLPVHFLVRPANADSN
ncbi:copper chaperone PCu(A)C [Dyella sp. M7H15-1]|uniref:copper chaperone PCu(A)C n=1 Tax=Dyella sp. M7H15-1 TaxID=2501295 RepID=UPI001F0BC639|nr:copper chaperone PCu(A)C [Dyella sp. M7H15-1]